LPYRAPSGRNYKNKKAYEKSLVGMFAELDNLVSKSRRRQKKVAVVSRGKNKKVRKRPVKTTARHKFTTFAERPEDIKSANFWHSKDTDAGGNPKNVERDMRQLTARVKTDSGQTVIVNEAEESGRYTPKGTVDSLTLVGDVIMIERINPRDGRVVAQTVFNIDPSSEHMDLFQDMEAKFLKWSKGKIKTPLSTAELRILGKIRKTGSFKDNAGYERALKKYYEENPPKIRI
jgi:hypothetical protein